MDPTTAIIQFIGIVLFSANVEAHPVAILPQIGHLHTTELKKWPDDPVQNEANVGLQKVENHVSIIMYRRQDRLNRRTGWKADGKLGNGWKYVVLNGERVEFLADGVNGAPAIPASLPRVAPSQTCHFNTQSLRPGYLPPLYSDARGVFEISEGTLSSCEVNTPTTTARVDTRLALDTQNKLVIRAKKRLEATKVIELVPDAVVYVANIPPWAIVKQVDAEMGAPHWTAYNNMLTQPCSVAPRVLPIDRDDITTMPAVTACDFTFGTESYKKARLEPPMDFRIIDAACSNAQQP